MVHRTLKGKSHGQMSIDKLPFYTHLEELRNRLIKSAVAIGVSFCLCYFFSDTIINILFAPVNQALPGNSKMVFTALTEGFIAYLKVAFWASLIVSSPVVLYQLWSFIAPGLYAHEKSMLRRALFWGGLLFVSGGLFGYWVVVPFVLNLTFGYANENLQALPRLKNYLAFAVKTLFTFGIIFELPFLMAVTSKAGIVSHDYFKKNRKISYIVLYGLAVILVPTDIFSQLLLLLPLVGVYEVGIYLSGWMASKQAVA